jgi:hypothetical protein
MMRVFRDVSLIISLLKSGNKELVGVLRVLSPLPDLAYF